MRDGGSRRMEGGWGGGEARDRGGASVAHTAHHGGAPLDLTTRPPRHAGRQRDPRGFDADDDLQVGGDPRDPELSSPRGSCPSRARCDHGRPVLSRRLCRSRVAGACPHGLTRWRSTPSRYAAYVAAGGGGRQRREKGLGVRSGRLSQGGGSSESKGDRACIVPNHWHLVAGGGGLSGDDGWMDEM